MSGLSVTALVVAAALFSYGPLPPKDAGPFPDPPDPKCSRYRCPADTELPCVCIRP